MLLAVPLHTATGGAAATAATGAHDRGGRGRFGIRLLEAPIGRRKDPRAYYQIVDHLPPGTTIRRRILVENASGKPLRAQIYAGAANVVHDRFLPEDGRAPSELTGWMSFDRPVLRIPPYRDATARVTIKVPPTAARGERYGVIWAQVEAPPDAVHNLGMINRVGIRTFLDVGRGGEPASDFQITSLTPARATDGRPEILAQVRNSGGRALEMAGALTLTDGPGKMNAGPFPATLGTTLLPGDSAPVSVVLDERLPDGPWKARLTLESGMIKRAVSATVTFPSGAGARSAAIRLSSDQERDALLLGGFIPAGIALFVLYRRYRPRRRRP